MKTTTAFRATLLATLATIVLGGVNIVRAEMSVWNTGEWPKSWPRELEPLRKQARTLEGPSFPDWHYLIPFTKREEFESAWPHLLKVKSKGAPIILVRGPRTGFFAINPAGVVIHAPYAVNGKLPNPETPLPGETDPRSKWQCTTYIELVVDGSIVDLNRIALPPDTPIIDERFKDAKEGK
jgi:hypothetical protein